MKILRHLAILCLMLPAPALAYTCTDFSGIAQPCSVLLDGSGTGNYGAEVDSGHHLWVYDANATTATGSNGAAYPSSSVGIGGKGSGNINPIIQGDTTAAIGTSSGITSATTTQIIALTSGKSIYVTHYEIHNGAAANAIYWVYGTGTNCGTGTTTLTGLVSLAANDGSNGGGGLGAVLTVPASQALCIVTSSAGPLGGHLQYTVF